MRPAAPLLVAAIVAAAATPAAAQVSVRLVPPAVPNGAASVELTARNAPLSEVLDRLSRQIGMKVVYEGAHPRQTVTVSLQGRSPADTVLSLLEGTGVNYALVSDPTGLRVETLLVAGSAPQSAVASSSSPSSPPGASRSGPGVFRRPAQPPGSGPDAIEEEDEPEDLENDFDEAPPAEAPEAAGAAGQADPNAVAQPAPGAPPQGSMPTSSFPVSPFAPQATPYTPQPFPPAPPGAGAPRTVPQQPQSEAPPAQSPPS